MASSPVAPASPEGDTPSPNGNEEPATTRQVSVCAPHARSYADTTPRRSSVANLSLNLLRTSALSRESKGVDLNVVRVSRTCRLIRRACAAVTARKGEDNTNAGLASKVSHSTSCIFSDVRGMLLVQCDVCPVKKAGKAVPRSRLTRGHAAGKLRSAIVLLSAKRH